MYFLLNPSENVPLPTLSPQKRDTSNSSNICSKNNARQIHNYVLPGICYHQNTSKLFLFCIMFSTSCNLYNKQVSCHIWEEVNMSINKICKDIGNGEVICEQNNVRMPSPSARRRRCGPLHSHRK